MPRRPSQRRPRDGETGPRDAGTRERIVSEALALFRKHGFDGTTMRDVAAAAGMSLGAAYYYFPSKEAIVLGYYESVFEERKRRIGKALAETQDLRERLRALYHVHFDMVRRDRKLLGALVRSVADPESKVSVFSKATAAVRSGSIDLCHQVIDVPEVGEDLRDLGALGLWTLDLAFMLYFIWDTSPKQEKTRQLIDNAIDLLLPAIPVLSLPFAAPMRAELAKLLVEANLVPE
jgi:AcrR family transcriptional regulator